MHRRTAALVGAALAAATFWAIAMPQFVLGFGMPFFFIATTSLALSSVDPEETASASGLSNFLRTTGAAFATSIMTTAWDNTASAKKSELAGALHPQAALDAMTARGLTADQAIRQLDGLTQVQAVMLSTNQMMLAAAVVFALAASIIWIAPRPRRAAGPGGGH